MISNLMMQLGNHTNASLEENMVRHMVLNAIRSYRTKFSDEYGEIVIACDNKNYWRKQIYPYYKANRKKNIEKSELDWQSIFECMNSIRSDLKEFFPYKVVDIESCEADDIIATLVKLHSTSNAQKILILSGDKDFIQLHKYNNVNQYDPVRKKWIVHEDPNRYLHDHILKGDAGDGIPNILSDDDTFVSGKRQKPMTQKKMDQIYRKEVELDTISARNYSRNQTLIDLTKIPQQIEQAIADSFFNQQTKTREKLFGYFTGHKLKHLVEHIQEF